MRVSHKVDHTQMTKGVLPKYHSHFFQELKWLVFINVSNDGLYGLEKVGPMLPIGEKISLEIYRSTPVALDP